MMKLKTKIVTCLLGYLLCLTMYATPLSGVAPTAVLIDSQWILTVWKPGIALPLATVIGNKQYNINPSVHYTGSALSNILLFLEAPVTDIEPIRRARINPEEYLDREIEIGLVGQVQEQTPEGTIDFDSDKKLYEYEVQPYVRTVTTRSGPFSYISLGSANPRISGIWRNIQIGAGYFVKNNDNQYQLIGLVTLVLNGSVEGSPIRAPYMNDIATNTYIDGVIVKKALE